MSDHAGPAFVLGVTPYRETSAILNVLCRAEGRVSLVARGLRGPRSRGASAAEPFARVRLAYRMKDGAGLGTLTDIEVERRCDAVRGHLDRYALAGFWMEAVGVAAQERASGIDLFDLTDAFLLALDTPEGAAHPFLAGAFGRLLAVTGFAPTLDSCIRCESPGPLPHLDATAGGALCARCGRAAVAYVPMDTRGAAGVPAVRLADLWGNDVGHRARRGAGAGTGLAATAFEALFRAHFGVALRSWPFLVSNLGIAEARVGPTLTI